MLPILHFISISYIEKIINLNSDTDYKRTWNMVVQITHHVVHILVEFLCKLTRVTRLDHGLKRYKSVVLCKLVGIILETAVILYWYNEYYCFSKLRHLNKYLCLLLWWFVSDLISRLPFARVREMLWFITLKLSVIESVGRRRTSRGRNIIATYR